MENIAGNGKTCRVQVIKKSPDHILKVIPDVEGGQKRELKLSKENRVHFSKAAGFIQVPVADSKELYGIKFKDSVEGEVFYTKLIKAVGVPCSYSQTMIGADGNPDPVGEKPAAAKPVAQSLPQPQAANKPANKPVQPPFAKATPSQPPVFATLGSQMPKSVAPQATPQAWPAKGTPHAVKEVKPNIQQNIAKQQSPLSQPQGQYAQQQLHRPSPQKQPTAVAMHTSHPNQGGMDRHNFPAKADYVTTTSSVPRRDQPTSQMSRPTTDPHAGPVQPMYHNIPFSNSPSYPNSQVRLPSSMRVNYDYPSQSEFSQQPNQPSVAQLKKQFQPQPPPPSQPAAMNRHSVNTKDYYDGPVASNTAAKMSVSGSGLGASSIARQQPQSQSQLSSSASPRLQRSLKPSDMKSVAEAMSDAINRQDEKLAREKFEALMNFMKTSKTGGKCEMNFSAYPEPDPTQSTFTLNIQVEFQNPNKEPIPIFLDDVSVDNTISVLSARVEHHFYIPRLSQNWIIGSRLVKGTDMNKTLKDFDIRGGSVEGVSVFMYVMHTKKAQVPNEAARVRQQHVQNRQQQQQDLTQQPTQSIDQEKPPPPRVVWTNPSTT